MKTFTSFWILLMPMIALGQSFNGRTNDIKVDMREPASTSFPAISWVMPALEYTNSQSGDINIELMVIGDIVLKEVRLFVIDENKNVREKNVALEPNAANASFKQRLRLPDGKHVLKVSATNSSGGQASSSRTILVGKDAISDAVDIDRKDRAILFATDKYENWTDLVNPVFDATTIAHELEQRYGFEVEVVENATHEDVFIKIADYTQLNYRPQDQLFIFFAGHGYFDDTFGEGFVVARNSLENDRAKTSYISHNRLRSVINNIHCDHIFLMMDVCFGGTFDPVVARGRGGEPDNEPKVNEFLVRKLSYKTRKYMTSGGKTYVSDGVLGKHSPFASKFIQALKASGGGDRILTLAELMTYVEKLVPEPRFGAFGEDHAASDFVFVARP